MLVLGDKEVKEDAVNVRK
ncbi:hypothetical protein ABEY41_19620 [Peribacillus butanolivorans]